MTAVLLASPSAAVEAVYPVENARQSLWASVGTRIVGFFRGSRAEAENRRLKRQVAELSLLRGTVGRLEEDNRRLRRALGYAARAPERWIAAGVLSSGGGAAGVHQALRVNRGSLEGVREGAVVEVPEGLVGRVTAVTPHTATVTLLSDPSLKVSCEIESDRAVRATGILSGGGDLLVLRHLRNAERTAPHARILTSGLGGVFPRGLEVGVLQSVRTDREGRAHEGEVQPSVGYLTLEDVFIRREN